MNNQRLLIYTDCYIYGGSERLMSSIVLNEELKSRYEIILSYRAHKLYNVGVKAEYESAKEKPVLLPLTILSNDTLIYQIVSAGYDGFIKKALIAPLWLFEKIGLYFVWNVIQFLLLLSRAKPDILHINNGGYPGARSCTHLALVASFICPGSVVYQVNNMATPAKSWWDRLIDRRLIQSCIFVNASQFAQERLRSLRGFPQNVLAQVFNTPPTEIVRQTREDILKKWSLPSQTKIICHVAFLTMRKGQRFVLGALYKLKQRKPKLLEHVALLFVGDGEDFTHLKELTGEYGLESNVIFTGYCRDSVDYIANCDIFLLPSVANEDMPLVVLTAMQHGKMIIASRLGGIVEEIEHGVSGILIDPKTDQIEEALASAIEIELENPNSDFGINAKTRYGAYFSSHAYAKSLIQLYNSLKSREGQ